MSTQPFFEPTGILMYMYQSPVRMSVQKRSAKTFQYFNIHVYLMIGYQNVCTNRLPPLILGEGNYHILNIQIYDNLIE